MKLSFMSFLFTDFTYRELIDMACKYGYDGLEWRAEAKHNHGVELESSDATIAEIRKATADAGLETSCLATSIKFASPDAAERDAMLERTKRFVELATKIGAPRIRFFGDPIPNNGTRAKAYDYEAEYIAKACEVAAPAGVRLVMETHSVFRAYDVGEMLYRTGYPEAFWVNWHLAHCLNHGEDVDEAYRHVKGRVDHAHFSLWRENQRTGERYPGDEYIRRQIELLGIEGFEGHFSLEMMPKADESGEDLVADHARRFRALCEELGY